MTCLASARAFGSALWLSVTLAGALSAQAPSGQTLEGRVVRSDSVPVAGASIRAMQGPTVHVVRSDDAGHYRITGMADGSWTVAVQAVGHVAFFERLTYAGPAMRRDFILKRVQTELDPVLVEGAWSGVRGLVADDRDLAVLADAKVTVVNSTSAAIVTDSSGRFSFEHRAGGVALLRIERAGYARRMLQIEVPERGAAQVVVRLDTVHYSLNDVADWQDMQLRLRSATLRAASVGREELERTGAGGLEQALIASPSIVKKAVVVERRACLFVDGVPKPNMTVAQIPVAIVDFVEAYPEGSEMSNTLERRWPRGAVCGDPTSQMFMHGGDRIAQYIAVWTRPVKPPAPAGRPMRP